MAPLTRCSRCGADDLADEEIAELIASPAYVVRCRVPAIVCRRCGERYFDAETVRRLEGIRARVNAGDLSGMRTAGALLEPAA